MHFFVIVIKHLVMSLCMLYAFDVIVSSVGVIVPINPITIVFVSILGMPAIFGLVVLQSLM